MTLVSDRARVVVLVAEPGKLLADRRCLRRTRRVGTRLAAASARRKGNYPPENCCSHLAYSTQLMTIELALAGVTASEEPLPRTSNDTTSQYSRSDSVPARLEGSGIFSLV